MDYSRSTNDAWSYLYSQRTPTEACIHFHFVIRWLEERARWTEIFRLWPGFEGQTSWLAVKNRNRAKLLTHSKLPLFHYNLVALIKIINYLTYLAYSWYQFSSSRMRSDCPFASSRKRSDSSNRSLHFAANWSFPDSSCTPKWHSSQLLSVPPSLFRFNSCKCFILLNIKIIFIYVFYLV